MNHVSDRERARLRGSVKAVVDESSKTEYDRNGNFLSWCFKREDGTEYGDSYAYDERGYLLSVVSSAWDGSRSEKTFSYDDVGRLAKIVDSRGELTVFAFDKEGKKTEVRSIQKKDERMTAAAIGIDVLFADIDGTATLGHSFGGNARIFKTIYNGQDQPAETQAFDAAGELLGRVLRTFDEKGRITNVREIRESPMSMFPAEQIARMIAAQSGVSQEERQNGATACLPPCRQRPSRLRRVSRRSCSARWSGRSFRDDVTRVIR